MSNSTIAHLSGILRSYVDEHGANNVRVHLPREWANLGLTSVGKVKVFYSTAQEIQIRVTVNGESFGYAAPAHSIMNAEQTCQSFSDSSCSGIKSMLECVQIR